MKSNIQEQIYHNFLKKEESLISFATFSREGIRLQSETEDMRPSFYRDTDRIIHSTSYIRYAKKTQVFSFPENDHVSQRMIHVQMVSKIARTIGRALQLNEDLLEAMALGHDAGHTPLGHLGEVLLNEISVRELGEYFHHNVQSMRNFLLLENKGRGSNLTIQTLDGILCHNGESLSNRYAPHPKTKEEVLEEYQNCYTVKNAIKQLCPMTLEGCVLCICDVIAYIGRDIEDAIRIGHLHPEDLPISITSVLGSSNQKIINTIITDIIENSYEKNYIEMSLPIYQAVTKLKEFNVDHIYRKSEQPEKKECYKKYMNLLFYQYHQDMIEQNLESEIYTSYLHAMEPNYVRNTSPARIVIDFLAGMTDSYFVKQAEKLEKIGTQS